jgi:hypothetical protein
MPYKTFMTWMFDGDIKSEIPRPTFDENGKQVTPDILKYNSPITNQYVLSMFINHGKLNSYLNTYFNNIGLYYMEKDELFKFIKRCVHDFKIQRNSIPYIKWKRDSKLFVLLRKKNPLLKNHDVALLCDLIDIDPNKDQIYSSFDLEKPEKQKMKGLSERGDVKETNVKKFIEKNFSVLVY